MSRSAGTKVEVEGHVLALTNLDKVLYPETGTTKGEVIGYYRAIAPWFVPHNARRPATRKRWPDGVDGPSFFAKNADSGTPGWVPTVELEHEHRTASYPLVDDAATLVWLAQIAALEIHVPQWRVGPRGGHHNPDRLVLDLDPGEGAGLAECIAVAQLCREILDEIGMPSVPVTSGSKGIHLYAALDGTHTAARASEFAKELARALAAEHRDLIVAEMTRTKRDGKVFIDWSQNNGSKTTVAPYSLRGRARPYAAIPRSWDELTDDMVQVEFGEVLARIETHGDLLAPLLGEPVEPARAQPDRLSTYRSMRDGSKTPEPVPEEPPAVGAGNSFVIQEHHARRLHWDFRLEHDGVLVSWALPKGPPTDPKKNHLAVMTEDHPLEYGSFEGTIPKGEYGGGEVTIWDAGTYECEKWRDGKEVIATLDGRDGGGLGGRAKFALIHTGKNGDPKQWLIHRMQLPDGEVASEVVAAEDLPVIKPMLATLGSAAELHGDNWAYETKWDGYRAIASVSSGEVLLRTRGGLEVSGTYPELRELGALLGGRPAILDGEIVALDRSGRSDFGRLQNHGDRTVGGDAHYMVFDVLHLDGESLLRQPYQRRREVLESLPLSGRFIHVPVTFGTDQELALRTSRELKLEGVIAKTIEGVYQPGARARTWIKIKNLRMQEVIVVGWTPGEGRRAKTLGSLLTAVTTDEGLLYVGKVGTGFTEKMLADLLAKLRPLEQDEPPVGGVPKADAKGAHWVSPILVGEVTFTEWTTTDRMRHPSWRGWRPDKKPEEVVRGEG